MKITTTQIVKAESGSYMVEYGAGIGVTIYENDITKSYLHPQTADDLYALSDLIRAIADLMKSAEVSR